MSSQVSLGGALHKELSPRGEEDINALLKIP